MRKSISVLGGAALACAAILVFPAASQFRAQYGKNISSFYTTERACELDPAGGCQQPVSPADPLPVADATMLPSEIAAIERIATVASTNLCIPAGERTQLRLVNQTGGDMCYRFTDSPDCLCQPGVVGGEACSEIFTSVAPSSTAVGFLYDVTQAWALNNDPRLYIIDSAHVSFAVTSYVDDTVTLTAALTPDEGDYLIVEAIVDYDTYTPASSAPGEVEAPAAVLACPGAFAGWYIYDFDDDRSFEVTGCDDTVDVIFSHSGAAITISGDVYFYTVLEDSTSTIVDVGVFHDKTQAWIPADYDGLWLFVDGQRFDIITNDATSLTLDTLLVPPVAEYFIYLPLIETNCAYADVRLIDNLQQDVYNVVDSSWIIAFPTSAGIVEVTRGEGLDTSPAHRVFVEPGALPLDIVDINSCVPDISQDEVCLNACLADGSVTAAITAAKYLMSIHGETTWVKEGVNVLAADGARFVVGTQLPVIVAANADFACRSAGGTGSVCFQGCF